MSRFSSSLLVCGLVLGVSACGGGGSGGGGGGGTTTRTFAKTDGGGVQTPADVISGNATLTARDVSSTALLQDYGADTTTLSDADVSVRKNANGEFTLVVDGVEHVFTAADRRPDGTGYDIDVGPGVQPVSMRILTGDLDEILTGPNNAGPDYLEVVVYSSAEVNGLNQPHVNGAFIIGTETRDADLAGLPAATYTGRADVTLYPKTGFTGSGTNMRGDLTMNADFAGNQVSGTVTNIVTTGPTPRPGTMTMEPTALNGNGFSGTLTGDATLATNGVVINNSSRYSGAFYGPAAENVGGVISIDGSLDGAPSNGVGAFRGE